ncbi:MAG: 4Fe-4S binding protein, partial [Candidatus Roizmanbacteria bacterium]|nr:4Fe-4S binding protein [Candidatus Roizmanbacteria bacterium]
RARDITLLTGIILIGLYLSSPFSILHVGNLILLRPSSAAIWYAVVITTIVSIILAGRFYCGWLCPFGALCEFIGRLPFKKWNIPHDIDEKWRKLKYVLLGAIIIIICTSRRIDYGNYETYVTLFSFSGNFLTWTLVAVSLIANLRIERFWCRHLCPVAAFTGMLSRKASGYISGNDCPMANKPNPHVSECIRCNRCYKGKSRDKET